MVASAGSGLKQPIPPTKCQPELATTRRRGSEEWVLQDIKVRGQARGSQRGRPLGTPGLPPLGAPKTLFAQCNPRQLPPKTEGQNVPLDGSFGDPRQVDTLPQIIYSTRRFNSRG